MPSERRTGRKGRRQKSSNKFLDGKSPVAPSEKESIQVGSSHVHVEEQVRYVDGVPTDSGKVYFVFCCAKMLYFTLLNSMLMFMQFHVLEC